MEKETIKGYKIGICVTLFSIVLISILVRDSSFYDNPNLVLEQRVACNKGCQFAYKVNSVSLDFDVYHQTLVREVCYKECQRNYYIEFNKKGEVHCAGYNGICE